MMRRNCSAWVAALDAGHLGPPHSEGRAAPGWRTYSQSYQDGVLERIFNFFGTENKRFVEFGLGYTEGKPLSSAAMDALKLNTRLLARQSGWSGVYFDALVEDAAFDVRRERLTRASIVDAFYAAGVPPTVDYVSIDVDSIDAWLLQGMLDGAHVRPRVISLEYNGNFLARDSVVMNETWVPWNGRSMYGASAKALVNIGARHGYQLLYLMSYFDLFLVREDVLATQCDLRSIPPLAQQARGKLPTKQHLPCQPYELDRMVDVRHLFGEMDAATARSHAREAVRRSNEALDALRRRGLRPTCCARTGTPVCRL
jgi:hypothetical protein